MHGLSSPERLSLAENDTGEWPPVGIINDERDVTLCSDLSQVPKLGIRDQIPTGIRGSRDTHGSDVGTGTQIFKIHMVFETMHAGVRYAGLDSSEHSRLERLIGVADVFRHERKKNPSKRAIGTATTKKIEKKVKRRLPARRHSNILRPNRPPELLAQQICEGLQHTRIAPGGIVDRQRAPQHGRVSHDLFHAGLPYSLHFRDVRGIPSSQHQRGRTDAGERLAQIVHEAFDSAATGEIPTEC